MSVEALVENAILKSLAVKVLDLVMASTDENLKQQVVALIDKLKATQGKQLDVKDFIETSPDIRDMPAL